eukprot:235785-Rhodomonas_salina.2
MSAPLSISLRSISSSTGFSPPLAAYLAASSRFVDVDLPTPSNCQDANSQYGNETCRKGAYMKAFSAPPLLPNSPSSIHVTGKSPPDRPRHTLRCPESTVRLRIFIDPLTSIRIVVLYGTLPSSYESMKRSTGLYFSKSGP